MIIEPAYDAGRGVAIVGRGGPMKVLIKTSNFSLTDALRNHALRRLRFALTFCDDRINQIVMRLSDTNGPRGGVDKCCRAQT